MRAPALHLVIPGPLEQRTGGYLYDAHVVKGLREEGWRVTVHELEGRFPDPDARARESLDRSLAGVPRGETVVVDGLAGGGLPEVLEAHAPRLRLVALVHHLLADETGLDARERVRLRELEGRGLAAVEGVVVTSPFTARRLEELGVDARRVRVVLPGTEPAVAAEGPGPGMPPTLLCVGTVSPRKGQDLLVQALIRLRDLPWRCVCAGSVERDAAFARGVIDAVAEAGMEARIRFPGELDSAALDGCYREASLFVLPSHFEGYGMALTEALARGLPVVSTTGGAIPHTVPAETGILVPPGDVDALERALRLLLGDPARRGAMARAALRHARELPRWETRGAAFAEAVEALRDAGTPGGTSRG